MTKDSIRYFEHENNNLKSILGELAEFEPQFIYRKKAIEALEKQIPKKPTHTYKTKLGEDTIYGECPNCNHTGLLAFAHDCCWWCGQKMDWK